MSNIWYRWVKAILDTCDNPYYLLWYGDIAIVFDDFDESWN